MTTFHEMRVEVEIRATSVTSSFGYIYAVWVPGTPKPMVMVDSDSECQFGYTHTYRGAIRKAKRAAKRVKRTSQRWVVRYTL